MKTKLCHIVLCLFLIGGLQLVSGLALAADSAGMVLSVVDGAWLERGGQKLAVKSKDAVLVNDVVTTDDRGKVQILFNDNTVVAIGNNSSLAIADFVFDDAAKGASFSAKMTEGVARFVTGKIVERNRDGFSVKTPSATVGIRGTTFAVEVSSSGVTDVTGLSINPAFPVSVTNSQTGVTAIIGKNGLAVKAASAGNTSYMAPAGKLAGLDAAVKINGGSQPSDKTDSGNASANTTSSSSAQKTDGAVQGESGDDGEGGEGGGNDSGENSANGSGNGAGNDSGTGAGTAGGAQNLGGVGMSGGSASVGSVSGGSGTTTSMDTSGGVMPSSALRLVASIPSPATEMVSPDKGLADIPHELILNDDTSGGVLGGGSGSGSGGNPGGNPGGGTGGGGTGGNPGGGGGTPVINYQGSYAGNLTRSSGTGIGTFSFKVGLGAGSGANKITDGLVDYQPTGLGGANVALEQSSNYSKVQGGNFDILFRNQGTGVNHMQMNGNIDGSNNISGNWNSWGTVHDSGGTLVDMNGHNGTIAGGKTP